MDSAKLEHSESSPASFTADDVYKAIADGLVTYDLLADPLSSSNRSRVYRDQSTLEFARRVEADEISHDERHIGADRMASIQPGDVISYDGKDYTVTLVGAKNVTLAHGSGSTEVSASTLDGLYRTGKIRIAYVASEDGCSITSVQLGALSPEELARAVERGRALEMAKVDPSAVGLSGRTLRRLKKLVRDTGANAVTRNLALVGNVRNRGNRKRKLPADILDLIAHVAKDYYNQPNSPNRSTVFREFVKACHEKNLNPCSSKSFNMELARHASTRKREGKRRAYQTAPIVWYLQASEAIHGVRPFEYVHIDHTPLDIVLVSGDSKKLLGRPWLSLAIDAESRAIVGFYLSFDPPSYRSCMMVLRDIVRRHGRLPSTIIVDNGAEFRGEAFRCVCDLYNVTLRYRPAGHPRHGSVMERVFGTAHTQLIHNLSGNTKQLKNVRTVTKSVSPDRQAEWTLPALHGALDKYFRDIYGTELHPAHGDQPEEHLQARLTETGLRLHRLVKLDRTFMIETCPPAEPEGTRKIDSQRGVKVNHLWYWVDAFKATRLCAKPVPVRVDPWDARVCYVFLNREWHQCVSKLASRLRGLTRQELESYYEEMSKRSGVKKQDLTPERIAEWMRVFDKTAFDSRLRDEQAEARLIYDALRLTSVDPEMNSVNLVAPPTRLSSSESPAQAPKTTEEASDAENDDYGFY
jgi:putative transposase